MIAYLAIFCVALAGYAEVGPWVIGAAALALASISYAEHCRTYERGREIGLYRIVDPVILRSVLNATIASAAAYGFGWVVRVI
jgi:hypothetical protein